MTGQDEERKAIIPPAVYVLNILPTWTIKTVFTCWTANCPQQNLLKENGFDLEYVFYINPGEILPEDELKELAEQGKFDAVRIKKGKYNFYIEYGMNGGTYDLNVKDFLDPSAINPPKKLVRYDIHCISHYIIHYQLHSQLHPMRLLNLAVFHSALHFPL